MKLEDWLQKLDDRLDRIEIIQGKQSVILEEHIRRTEILEGEIVPIKTHVAVVGAMAKVLAILGTIVGIVVGIVEIYA